jgi:prevent-host-death family protein
MNIIPPIATVADVQRGYRKLVDRVNKSGEPLVVVNNGKPDAVILGVKTYNDYVKKLKAFEEASLLRRAEEALDEHKAGKTVRLKKNQTLLDLLH